jgi:hypothetical protein
MTRKWVYSALAALAIGVLGSIWFVNHFERVTTQERVGYSAKARQNPWLATQFMFARLGMQADTVDNVDQLLHTPQPGVLIVPGRRATWSAAQRQTLLEWVEAGGHLLVESNEAKASDDILDALGVHRRAIDYSKPPRTDADAKEDDANDNDADAADDTSGERAVTPAQARQNQARILAIALPGTKRHARVWMRGGESFAMATKPEFEVRDGYGVHILGFLRGKGRVTVINDLFFMRSGMVGEHDHAVFAWQLVQLGRTSANPPDAMHESAENDGVLHGVFYSAQRRSLPDWLIGNAPLVLASGAMLLLFWLWRVAPRFGPAIAERPPARPQWLAHLRAAGRFLWQSQEHAFLMDVLRRSALTHVSSTHADFPYLAHPQRMELLTGTWGLTQDEARQLLQGPPHVQVHAHDLVRMAGMAQRLALRSHELGNAARNA